MKLIKRLYEIYLNCNQKICIDSRSNEIENAVFFAIQGDNFNGNHFIEDAFSKGAKYAVSDDKELVKKKDNKAIILVENTLQTLQNLATQHRQSLNIPIIAITGSNGKTTTKEILTHILKSTFNPLSTSGNFNNHIGVPLTILSINKQHNIAVIEMGANHVGEIKELCKIAQPTHGIITNIGDAHLEGFGSIENIKIAKNELFEYLKEHNKIIIYNSDDEILKELINDYPNTRSYKKPHFFPLGPTRNKESEYHYEMNPFLVLKNINLKSNSQDVSNYIETKLIGQHNINNIIAAIKIANLLEVSYKNIKNRLDKFELKNNRCQFIKTKKNLILLDAYNANPTSMYSGLQSFLDIIRWNRKFNNDKPKPNQFLYILGDMLELGENEVKYHQEILDYLSYTFLGLSNKVILVGNIFSKTIIPQNSGLRYCVQVKSNIEAAEILKNRKFTEKEMLVFIKGSRKLELEKLIDYL
ncbi:MAG: UDP-N-acetylmuramoyl-tripeptide--D-alanyl-D-alanine ligase [Flavobacteriales bacterium]|nr:UDP-N-acetylmuramoyl-tripeptide--D-alanyl-D-alanine ligase [Flavobacteriales bacterium]